ncbi:hypothetical protein BOO71_0002173 [Deinococcus marmoris]|uniref:Uncharacterized protein n=1 Tax=Deinococcus marmoris TaxID=249408 RepID=A0A1U7P3A5_9DEIO|nr:hypothetical protein BOO71_0002173 [Deinococcus marmoris]
MLVACALGGAAHAEGSFQVRYFLPSTPLWQGLSADADWRGEALGGQLSARTSWNGPESQSFNVTYTLGQRVLYTQYDASRTLTTGSRTAVLLAQQGFTAPTRGLRSVTSTFVYTDGDSSGTSYRVFSGDLGAGGAFSPTWTWTAGTGGSLTDVSADPGSGGSVFTSRNLALRARVSVAGQFGGPRPGSVTLGATADHTETLRLSTGTAAPPSTRYGLNAGGTASLSASEKLSATARLDNEGSYSLDTGLSSTRVQNWTGDVGINVGGRADFGVKAATPASLGWRASISRTGQPWSGKLGYAGSGGETPSHALDVSVAYSPPPVIPDPDPAATAPTAPSTFSVQGGAGVTWQRQPGVTPGGQVTQDWRVSYRTGAGLNLSNQTWNAQVQLSLSAAPYPDAAGVQQTRLGGSLSGNVAYTRDPLTLSLSSNLNYVPSGSERWTGDIGVQALYKVSEPLQVSGNVRFRPGTVNSYQAGIGLRFNF